MADPTQEPNVQDAPPIQDVASVPVQEPATPAPASTPVASPAAAPPEQEPLNLSDTVNWAGADGTQQSAAIREMIEAHDTLRAIGGKDGLAALQKLQSGDPDAVAELTRKMAQSAIGETPPEEAPPSAEGPQLSPEQLSIMEQMGGMLPMLAHFKQGFLQQTVQTIVSQEQDQEGNARYPTLARMASGGVVAPVINALQSKLAELCGDEEPSPEILSQGLALIEQDFTGISQALTGQSGTTPAAPAPPGAVLPSPMGAGPATTPQTEKAPPMFKEGSMEVSPEYAKWSADQTVRIGAALEQQSIGQL